LLQDDLRKIKDMINDINKYVYGTQKTRITNVDRSKIKGIFSENNNDEYQREINQIVNDIQQSNDMVDTFERRNITDYNNYKASFPTEYNNHYSFGPNYLDRENKYLTMSYNDYDDMIDYDDKMKTYIRKFDSQFLTGAGNENYHIIWGVLIFILIIVLIIIIIIRISQLRMKEHVNSDE
jgi:hypothetical protein